MYYLPGDNLSCTNTPNHTIQLEPGVTPMNTWPYRLPENQKKEIDRQVVEDVILTPSEFPWNITLVIVVKRGRPNEKPKRGRAVDFCKLNEKTIGDGHPLLDITEVLGLPRKSK